METITKDDAIAQLKPVFDEWYNEPVELKYEPRDGALSPRLIAVVDNAVWVFFKALLKASTLAFTVTPLRSSTQLEITFFLIGS